MAPHSLGLAWGGGARLLALRPVSREDFPPIPELFAVLVVIDVSIMIAFSMILIDVAS